MNKDDLHPGSVEVTREPVVIPTYVPYAADKNPIFYEKRAYQGAHGRAYPIAVTDRLRHEKTDKAYDSVTLENEYIKIMVLPQIGGRIHIGLDKTNGYNFIYHNTVIKPALIGIAGPWVSGGIEFNWPQHHRPTTFQSVETALEENADGSRTAWVGETEPLYHLKCMAGITVCPGRSYLKVKVRAYNGTPFPQPFMWWANLGVHVNENYRINFPPDVQYLAYHDRAFIDQWPMIEDRFSGNGGTFDGSWFKNHENAGSFMVMDGSSRYNFIEGYDEGRQAGVIHVADHHVSSGKKLFTWGNGEFAQAWKGSLTDSDGHYVELMTGVYTDNQPDFSWMQPNETRTFEHCWYPVRAIGLVKNATEDAAVSLELTGDIITVGYHATGLFQGATAVVKAGDRLLLEQKLDIDPASPFITSLPRPAGLEDSQIFTALYSADGCELVRYRPEKAKPGTAPEPRKPSPEPKDIEQIEELYIHGLHIEQYRHHSLEPSSYYLEALRRDPGDIRCNNAMGLLSLRKGQFESAEGYFTKALARLTSRNTNPYDSEPLYNLAVARRFLHKLDAAYDNFYKAAWSYGWKSPAYHAVAELDCRKGDHAKALEHIGQALRTNAESIRTLDLKSAILRHLGRAGEALALANGTISMDRLDHWARFELYFAAAATHDEPLAARALTDLQSLMTGKSEAYIAVALEYDAAGMISEAKTVLETYIGQCGGDPVYPMAYYLMSSLCQELETTEEALTWNWKAEAASPDYCFPNRLEYIAMLQLATHTNPVGAKAWYYLGNLFYDKQRYSEAIERWEKSRKLDSSFAIVHRNLALAYFDKQKDGKRALESMKAAFAANPADSRLLYELLQVCKNSNLVSAEDRLKLAQTYPALVAERNDCYVEMVILLLQLGRLTAAAEKVADHVYDVYEGGEGKLAGVYEWIHLLRSIQRMQTEPDQAFDDILSALTLPENFHEGRNVFFGTNHVHYYAALAAEKAGNAKAALQQYRAAASFVARTSEATFYQGLALGKLGDGENAKKAFEKLLAEGQNLVQKGGKYDFFATGTPTPAPFEGDREKRNSCEGLYLKALAHLGLGRTDEARAELEQVLARNPSHLGAWLYAGKTGIELFPL